MRRLLPLVWMLAACDSRAVLAGLDPATPLERPAAGAGRGGPSVVAIPPSGGRGGVQLWKPPRVTPSPPWLAAKGRREPDPEPGPPTHQRPPCAPGQTRPWTCSDECFCWENPVPHGKAVVAGYSFGPDEAWISTDDGELVRWDGGSWQRHAVVDRPVVAFWGAAADDLWAAGGETLHHWDGWQWTHDERPDRGAVLALWGFSSSDVWAVGDGVHRWDGTSWSRLPQPQEDVKFRSVWGTDPARVWVVGGGGAMGFIHLWDGSAWQLEFADYCIRSMNAVGGSGEEVWARGVYTEWCDGARESQHLQWLHREEEGWVVVAPGYVGDAPTREIPTPTLTEPDLDAEAAAPARPSWPLGVLLSGALDHEAWGSGPADVWSAEGGLKQWSGSTLTRHQHLAIEGAAPDMRVQIARDGAVWLAGNGAVWRDAGGGWRQESRDGPVDDRATRRDGFAFVLDEREGLWSIQEGGNHMDERLLALRELRDGTLREVASTVVSAPIDGPDHGFTGAMVGDLPGWAIYVREGLLARWDGSRLTAEWTSQRSLGGAWAAAEDDVWVVGTEISHWDGVAWDYTPVATPAGRLGAVLSAVWGSGPTDVWAGGSAGLVHFDGTDWTEITLEDAPPWSAIAGTGPNDVWVAGQRYLWSWDGEAWRRHGMPMRWPWLRDIAVGTNDVLAVSGAALFRYVP